MPNTKLISYPPTRGTLNKPHCIGRCLLHGVIVLVFLSAFAAPVSAQVREYKKAMKLLEDAGKLLGKPSANSWRQAIEKLEAALPLFVLVQDPDGVAICLQGLGRTHYELGEIQKAIDYDLQALSVLRAIKRPGVEAASLNAQNEAATLNNLGVAYRKLGETREAIKVLEESLKISAKGRFNSGDPRNFGEVYSQMGDYTKARDYYNQSLTICRADQSCSESNTLNHIGLIDSDQGDYESALENYRRALEKADALLKPAVLNNMGQVYLILGDAKTAFEFTNQALKDYREIGDRDGEATALNNLGEIAAADKPQRALTYYNQALAVRQQEGDRPEEATTLNNIGLAYFDVGQSEKSQSYYDQALTIQRTVGDLDGEATTLNNIGLRYDSQGNRVKALEYYQQALLLLHAAGKRQLEAVTLSNCMAALRETNRGLAIFFGKQSINTLQELRANIHVLDKKLQKMFLRSNEDQYRMLADLLISEGRLAEAQQETQKAMLSGAIKAPAACQPRTVVAAKSDVCALPAYIPDSSKPFAHPYYWAPFVLFGNWR